jgi:ribosomal protein S8
MSLVKLANVAAHIQNVTRAHLTTTSIPYTKLHLQVASHLYNQGFISSIQRGSLNGPDEIPTEVTPDNISTRRLWLGMKYRDSKPVISKFQLISKPSLRMHLKPDEIKELANGKLVRRIRPLSPSELVLVKCNKTEEVMELSEAAAQGRGGEVLCRVR